MSDGAPWTLEDELCRIANRPDISAALSSLGLLRGSLASLRLQPGDWVRGGAETYIYRFQVHDGNQTTDLLIKACVAFSPAVPLEKLLAEWIARRDLLQTNGISTPKLYGVGPGVLLEEYVPHSAKELLDADALELIHAMAKYAGTLSKLGFAPVGPFDDLRSRGNDIVAVDFGQDLGPPGQFATPRVRMFDALVEYLAHTKVALHADVLDQIRWTFAASGGEFIH